MSNTIAHEQDISFLREVWAEYGVGAFIILARFGVRIKTVGFKGFQGDDYFSMAVLFFWTLDAMLVDFVYWAGTNVDVTEAQMPFLTSEQLATLTYGSKCELAAWYSYTALIWCMKGTMLFFFQRLTFGLWQSKLVIYLGYGCIMSYAVVFMTITFGCWPFWNNWQVVPGPGIHCGLKNQNFLVAVVFNVLTDAAILMIPLPLLWKLKVPMRRKIIIGLLLSSGIFVITAAVIRVVLSLGALPSALNINRWGVRETLVGIVTINVPILRPLFTQEFWSITSSNSTMTEHGNPTASIGAHEISSPRKLSTKCKISTSTNRDAASITGSGEYIFGNSGANINNLEAGRGDVVVSMSYQVHTEDGTKIGDEEWEYGAGGANRVVVRSGNTAKK